MTAQPVEFHGASARPPRIAMKAADIRRHLTPASRAAFQAELDEAVDSGDMAAVNQAKKRWWGQSLIETDPDLQTALETTEVEYGPSPLPR